MGRKRIPQLPGEEPHLVKEKGVRGRKLSTPVGPVAVPDRWYDDPATEGGKPTQLTSTDNRQANSLHLGYAHFLKNRSFESLKLALARHGSPRAAKFLALLINPRYADIDIATLADKCGITFLELMAVWRTDKLGEAMANLIDAAPTVAAHTALDAQSIEVCCARCDGGGLIKVNQRDVMTWVTCTNCDGTGKTRKAGDKASREMVLEATGIVKNKSGVSININNGANNSVESVLEEVEQAIDVHSEEVL